MAIDQVRYRVASWEPPQRLKLSYPHEDQLSRSCARSGPLERTSLCGRSACLAPALAVWPGLNVLPLAVPTRLSCSSSQPR